MTQCCCDPEVVSVHLFTLTTVAVCLAADCKHNDRKDKLSFFWFQSNTKEYKKWEDSSYQILIPKKEMSYAIATVNKKFREPHCVI